MQALEVKIVAPFAVVIQLKYLLSVVAFASNEWNLEYSHYLNVPSSH